MPTKEDKRHARGLVEALELRVHAGPPVCATEIRSAQVLLSAAGNLYWGRRRTPVTPRPDSGSNPQPISVTG